MGGGIIETWIILVRSDSDVQMNMEKIVLLLTRDQCVQITTIHAEGNEYRALGLRFGVAHTTITRVVQRYHDTLTHDYYRG